MGKVIGWLLITVGGLWVLFTGGCSLLVLGSAFQGHTDAGSVLPLLAIGLVCVAPGALTLWAGLRMIRKRADTQ